MQSSVSYVDPKEIDLKFDFIKQTFKSVKENRNESTDANIQFLLTVTTRIAGKAIIEISIVFIL